MDESTVRAERSRALDQLPESYARALRLRDEGLPDEAIASRLEINPHAIEPFMRLAQAKLAAVRL